MSTDLPDFYPGGADVVSRPEWAAKQATDKNFYGAVPAAPASGATAIEYTVPAGKRLYISHMSVMLDGDETPSTFLWLRLGGTVLSLCGGQCGGALVLAKPVVYESGQTMTVTVVQRGTSTWTVAAAVTAWEEPA